MYTCRTCHVAEPAASPCVYQNKLYSQVGDTAGVTQDVGSDPTVGLPEFCTSCGEEVDCSISGKLYDRAFNNSDDYWFQPWRGRKEILPWSWMTFLRHVLRLCFESSTLQGSSLLSNLWLTLLCRFHTASAVKQTMSELRREWSCIFSVAAAICWDRNGKIRV